ncbi:PQQ-binding-like beta-propeller repeat protein [Corynebacterium sp. L4756]|uniref:outer membrane protein assembly factor BamB family protein n=1 Tax=unclassified Corynebacterium TaxID=2624378 RepID=UPI00374D03B4
MDTPTQHDREDDTPSDTVRGTVVDSLGQPLPRISVSDGRRVTLTDDNGAFSFNGDPDNGGALPGSGFITVTVPAGLTADRWFCRTRSGEDLRFVLERATDPAATALPYRFAHLTDLHIGGAAMYPQPAELGDAEVLGALLRRIAEQTDVASFMITGDLTDRGVDDQYRELLRTLSHSPRPWHTVPGNHDHMAGDRYHSTVSRTGYEIHTGDPAAYETWMGPRWYSFDLPGLHVVCMDWLTDELDLDAGIQRSWLAADLAAWNAGGQGERPWILLYHDQPTREFLDSAPYPPKATFSGHRHTDRIVKTDDVLHVNTPPAMFGGVDHSVAGYRVVEWDGEQITVVTGQSFPPAGSGGTVGSAGSAGSGRAAAEDTPAPVTPLWQHEPDTTGYRAVAAGQGTAGTLVAYRACEGGEGRLSCLDLATGRTVWELDLDTWPAADAPVRGSVDGSPVAVIGLVDGSVIAVDDTAGTLLWRFDSTDPMRRFSLHSPAVTEGTVIAGDVSDVVGISLDDGTLRWRRRDLANYQIFITMASPAPDGSRVAVGSFPAPERISVLDAATGGDLATAHAQQQSRTTGESPFSRAALPVATPVWAAPTGIIYTTLNGTSRLNPFTATVEWQRLSRRPWNEASPLCVPDGVVVTDSSGEVSLLDVDTGDTRWTWNWSRDSSGAPLVCRGTYRRTPEPLSATPALAGEEILVPTLCASVVVLDVSTGEPRRVVPTYAPVTATPVPGPVGHGPGLLMVTVESDGGVRCYPLQ